MYFHSQQYLPQLQEPTGLSKKAVMSHCGKWEQFALMGNPYTTVLSQHFDDPHVGILPLLLLGILPFIHVSLHFDLSQSWALPTFFFPQPSPLPLALSPLPASLPPLGCLTPAPAPAHMNSRMNTVLVYLSSEYRTTSVIWSTEQARKSHDYN